MSISPSRSALIGTNSNHFLRSGRLLTTVVFSACFKPDNLLASTQIVSGAIRSIYTARRFLGFQTNATFLRWRWGDTTLFISLGLSGVVDADDLTRGLQLAEDVNDQNPLSRFRPATWLREGDYATIVQDTQRSSSVICDTREIVANTRLMMKGW
jgi:hypothetical protein